MQKVSVGIDTYQDEVFVNIFGELCWYNYIFVKFLLQLRDKRQKECVISNTLRVVEFNDIVLYNKF